MKKFLTKWFINVIALVIVIRIIAGVSIDNLQTVLVVALILGLLNTFIRPFILIITLPLTILTFGIFTFFINGFLFYLAAKFVNGFTVVDFWSAFWAALLFSAISSLLNFLLTPKITVRYNLFRSQSDHHHIADEYDIIDVESKVGEISKDKE